MARQALLAHVARAQHSARAAGRPWSADGDLAAADLGLPGLFGNPAFVLRPDGVELAVQRCAEFFPAGAPFLITSAFPTADLRSLGLELVGHPPLMFLPPTPRAPVSPRGLRIEEVTDSSQLARFERTLVDAFPLAEWSCLPAGAVFAPSGVGLAPVRYWTGSVGGRVVCTAASVTHAGVNLVEWVSTEPAYRGHGYGAAITWAAATADPELPAVLLASDDGRPVYERMGFFALHRWTLWARPGR